MRGCCKAIRLQQPRIFRGFRINFSNYSATFRAGLARHQFLAEGVWMFFVFAHNSVVGEVRGEVF